MATGQDQSTAAGGIAPPPYTPSEQGQQYIQQQPPIQQYVQQPPRQQYVQQPHGQQYVQQPPGQQYVQQFVQQNPQGFVQDQQPPYMKPAGFSDINTGYGYNQPMSQMSTQQMSNTTVVVSQPQAAPVLLINQRPYSYLVPAILSCLFCCWLLGIGAIIAAVMSQGQSDEMQYDEARKTATIARALTIASFVCGMVGYVVLIVIFSSYG